MVTAGLLPPICCAHVHVSMASNHLSGGPFEIVAHSAVLSSTEPMEQHAQDYVTWAGPKALVLFNQR